MTRLIRYLPAALLGALLLSTVAVQPASARTESALINSSHALSKQTSRLNKADALVTEVATRGRRHARRSARRHAGR